MKWENMLVWLKDYRDMVGALPRSVMGGQGYAHPSSREHNSQIKLYRLVEQRRKEMQESILERLPSNRAI